MGALEKSIGWSLMDSNGELASCLLFKTEKAANKYKTAMNERYPEGKYELIELFVRRAEHGIDGRTAQVGRMGSKGIDREEASPPAKGIVG